jgi:hypothetical protein
MIDTGIVTASPQAAVPHLPHRHRGRLSPGDYRTTTNPQEERAAGRGKITLREMKSGRKQETEQSKQYFRETG